ncbi:MAG: protein kinase [Candidatus Berkiella sp.]
MLNTLTPSQQILQIHRRILKEKNLAKKSDKSDLASPKASTALAANIAAFEQRLPKKISARLDMFMESSRREATLISPLAYRVLRQFQLERVIAFEAKHHPRPSNIYIEPKSLEGKALKLKYPVMIGENGEMVAVMRTGRQQLGEGGYGTVYIGMDLDSHQLVALKYHKLNKIDTSDIQLEKEVMDDIGRLVTSYVSESMIITADELAWGCDFTQVMKDRAKNPMDKKEIHYRLDMAIKFLEQVKRHHDMGYINRDIKLDNMMWDDKTKKATMIDFGFAIKATNIENDDPVGTPIYMAPLVSKGTFSQSTDAYACGVALVEMFSKHDLFKKYPQWLKALQTYLMKNDANVFADFFVQSAPDLFNNKHLPKELKPVVKVIKCLINPDDAARLSVEDALVQLRQHAYLLGFDLFNQSKKAKEPICLTLEDLENPLIMQDVYSIVCDKLSNISIDSKSMLLILKQSIIANNPKALQSALEQSEVFLPVNSGYAQMLLKKLFAQYMANDESNMLLIFMQNATRKSSLNAMTQSLQNIIKETRATAVMKNDEASIAKLDTFESKILPALLKHCLRVNVAQNEEEYDAQAITTSHALTPKRSSRIHSENTLVKPESTAQTRRKRYRHK